MRQELAGQQQEANRSLQRAEKRKRQITDERQKLLQAHYSGAIPQDVLASEMHRFTRELAEAEVQIKAAKVTTGQVEATLLAALIAADNCQRAYLAAPGHVRRQINQGFFTKLFIGEDGGVARAELTEPFAALLDSRDTMIYTDPATLASIPSQLTADERERHDTKMHVRPPYRPSDVHLAPTGVVTESNNNTTPRTLIRRGRGVNVAGVVDPARENWNCIFDVVVILCERLDELDIESMLNS